VKGLYFNLISLFSYSQLFRLRIKYQQNPKEYTVIVASYDVVRSDISFFSYVVLFFSHQFVYFILFSNRTIPFNYCILDEGHVIRNSKTKLSKAIRQISAGIFRKKCFSINFLLYI